jgi:hypothetical protein
MTGGRKSAHAVRPPPNPRSIKSASGGAKGGTPICLARNTVGQSYLRRCGSGTHAAGHPLGCDQERCSPLAQIPLISASYQANASRSPGCGAAAEWVDSTTQLPPSYLPIRSLPFFRDKETESALHYAFLEGSYPHPTAANARCHTATGVCGLGAYGCVCGCVCVFVRVGGCACVGVYMYVCMCVCVCILRVRMRLQPRERMCL